MTFTVYGVARPKGSSRAFMPKGARFPVVTSDNAGLKGWENLVRYAAQQAAGATIEGPVRVHLAFALPRPQSLSKRVVHHLKKPDLDKLTRAVIDALTGIAFKDDSQVTAIRAVKCYQSSGEAPQCYVCVEANP